MADLIDRDAVIWITAETGALETQRRVKELPTVNRWISVEDALPENSHPVLITWVNNYPVMSCYEKDKGKPFTGCAHYCNGKWYWYSQFSDDIISEYGEYQETVDVDVIAWMPMPDAYKPPKALYKVGDLVEFIDEDKHKDNPSQFPRVGTVGQVKSIDYDGDLWVLWPEGSVKLKGICCTAPRRVVLAGSRFTHENFELDNLFSEMG